VAGPWRRPCPLTSDVILIAVVAGLAAAAALVLGILWLFGRPMVVSPILAATAVGLAGRAYVRARRGVFARAGGVRVTG